jgi:hypothetical protein
LLADIKHERDPFDPKITSNTSVVPQVRDCGYYQKLGENKKLEDMPGYDYSDSKPVFDYLASRISDPAPFSMEDYLKVAGLFAGRDAPYRIQRTCINYAIFLGDFPEGFAASSSAYMDKAFGTWDLHYAIGNFMVYKVLLSPSMIISKLKGCIDKFNRSLASASSDSERFHAIVHFFYECEQLRPVDHSARTNLAILNYLLSKYGFPSAILDYKDEFIFSAYDEGVRHTYRLPGIYNIGILHFPLIMQQVEQGIVKWCTVAKVEIPEFLR